MEKEKQENIYDAGAPQRYEFEVTENGQKFDTAHIYAPLSDEQYIAFLKTIKITSDDKDHDDQESAAAIALWDSLVTEVENFDTEGREDWRALIDLSEKRDSLANFLAVAVIEPESVGGARRRSTVSETETVTTEAYFNFPNTAQQTHKLKKRSDEWRKKYDRIKAKEWKEEITKGLRRKPKFEYVSQHEALGALYDEMLIEASRFKDNIIPLRFKTTVLKYLFGSKLDEKK